MEKQTLSTLATITAISVAIITPTSALAEDMKYNQAIYEEIGMDRSEVIDWVQDPKRNIYGKTEDETMQYLIASTKEEQASNIREWIQQPHAAHGQINGLLKESGLHVMACGRYPYNPLGGQQRLHRQDTITQNQHGRRFLLSLARVVIGQPIQQLQK